MNTYSYGVFIRVASVGILLRVLMGFAPYSGENTPPVFGDYEAQRHWMEITTNLPISEWYIDSDRNDPNYWQLDYPPLSAFHEYALGRASEYFEPGSTAWFESRGYETSSHRWFMRMSVLVSDVLVYFTSAAFLVTAPIFSKTDSNYIWFGLLLLNPVLVYVDHGHFQYNCVAMGLLLLSIGLFFRGRTYLSAVMFTLSFLFKQTFAYFAPVFLAIMLGEAIQLGGLIRTVQRVTFLAVVVLVTIASMLYPFMHHCDSFECMSHQLLGIFRRIFPLHRSIFEDYVANFWIVVSPVFHLRGAGEDKMLVCGYTSLVFTIGGFIECCWTVLRKPAPRVLPLALACTSLSFYLFSWMVHEKGIALPVTSLICAVPLLLNSGDMWVLTRFYEAAFLSLWHLIRIEGAETSAAGIGGIGLMALYLLGNGRSYSVANSRFFLDNVACTLNFIALFFAVMQSLIPGPTKYPHLWVLGTCVANFGTFVIVWRQLVRLVEQTVYAPELATKKIA